MYVSQTLKFHNLWDLKIHLNILFLGNKILDGETIMNIYMPQLYTVTAKFIEFKLFLALNVVRCKLGARASQVFWCKVSLMNFFPSSNVIKPSKLLREEIACNIIFIFLHSLRLRKVCLRLERLLPAV